MTAQDCPAFRDIPETHSATVPIEVEPVVEISETVAETAYQVQMKTSVNFGCKAYDHNFSPDVINAEREHAGSSKRAQTKLDTRCGIRAKAAAIQDATDRELVVSNAKLKPRSPIYRRAQARRNSALKASPTDGSWKRFGPRIRQTSDTQSECASALTRKNGPRKVTVHRDVAKRAKALDDLETSLTSTDSKVIQNTKYPSSVTSPTGSTKCVTRVRKLPRRNRHSNSTVLQNDVSDYSAFPVAINRDVNTSIDMNRVSPEKRKCCTQTEENTTSVENPVVTGSLKEAVISSMNRKPKSNRLFLRTNPSVNARKSSSFTGRGKGNSHKRNQTLAKNTMPSPACAIRNANATPHHSSSCHTGYRVSRPVSKCERKGRFEECSLDAETAAPLQNTGFVDLGKEKELYLRELLDRKLIGNSNKMKSMKRKHTLGQIFCNATDVYPGEMQTQLLGSTSSTIIDSKMYFQLNVSKKGTLYTGRKRGRKPSDCSSARADNSHKTKAKKDLGRALSDGRVCLSAEYMGGRQIRSGSVTSKDVSSATSGAWDLARPAMEKRGERFPRHIETSPHKRCVPSSGVAMVSEAAVISSCGGSVASSDSGISTDNNNGLSGRIKRRRGVKKTSPEQQTHSAPVVCPDVKQVLAHKLEHPRTILTTGSQPKMKRQKRNEEHLRHVSQRIPDFRTDLRGLLVKFTKFEISHKVRSCISADVLPSMFKLNFMTICLSPAPVDCAARSVDQENSVGFQQLRNSQSSVSSSSTVTSYDAGYYSNVDDFHLQSSRYMPSTRGPGCDGQLFTPKYSPIFFSNPFPDLIGKDLHHQATTVKSTLQNVQIQQCHQATVSSHCRSYKSCSSVSTNSKLSKPPSTHKHKQGQNLAEFSKARDAQCLMGQCLPVGRPPQGAFPREQHLNHSVSWQHKGNSVGEKFHKSPKTLPRIVSNAQHMHAQSSKTSECSGDKPHIRATNTLRWTKNGPSNDSVLEAIDACIYKYSLSANAAKTLRKDESDCCGKTPKKTNFVDNVSKQWSSRHCSNSTAQFKDGRKHNKGWERKQRCNEFPSDASRDDEPINWRCKGKPSQKMASNDGHRSNTRRRRSLRSINTILGGERNQHLACNDVDVSEKNGSRGRRHKEAPAEHPDCHRTVEKANRPTPVALTVAPDPDTVSDAIESVLKRLCQHRNDTKRKKKSQWGKTANLINMAIPGAEYV
ncbi:histone-lysine N-methyltransferase ASH1L-like [Lethenteron reissneri]|uniref:histone-lysine N-methyltransferase ASH1L-like n=1 Tax=Lethenteron reissneri TaxID=7753 RepID=UPI002AB668EA|nr:histone-lysine N-methyltransferase ASH1L-like [Lethenteron reissneri]